MLENSSDCGRPAQRPALTAAELLAHARQTVDAGRVALPIVVEAEPIAPNDPDAVFVHAKTDAAGFNRLWAAALFHRTLDGYEAALTLFEAGLDTEARAHTRIAFDHLLSFAWVVADCSDITRPLRIARYGMGFYEKQALELARYRRPTEPQLNELGLAVHVNSSDLRPPPNTRDLCGSLDEELAPVLRILDAKTAGSFTGWYSYLYRGASAFVHPTSAGIEPLIEQVPGAFQVAPSRVHAPRVLEVVVGQLAAVILIAHATAPWLVEGQLVECDAAGSRN